MIEQITEEQMFELLGRREAEIYVLRKALTSAEQQAQSLREEITALRPIEKT